MPFGAKDIFYTAGLPTEAGSKVLAGFVPAYDATSVARLKDAGAVLVGKLHTTEFATYDPAPTRNPWNLACTPGGSSSGSAAAVAARMVPLALGTQTIGSNVRPAAYCGLVGLKPTFGRISTRGVIPLTYTQDHVGLMARRVEDIALGLLAVAGHDPEDPSSSREPVPDYLAALTRRRPPRVGLVREFFFERATAEVARVTTETADRLARAGATIEEVKLPPSFRAVHAAAHLIMRSDTASIHAELYAQKADLYRPAIRSAIEMGMLLTGDLYVRSLRIRRQFRRRAGAAARPLRRPPDADDARPRARGHSDRRPALPGPMVAERPALDHRPLRTGSVGTPPRHPTRERRVHGARTPRRRRMVRGRPRPRRGANPLRRTQRL